AAKAGGAQRGRIAAPLAAAARGGRVGVVARDHDRRSHQGPVGAKRRDPDRRGGVDDRVPRAAEPGRDGDEELSDGMDLRPQIAAETRKLLARRWFFKECGVGLGGIALAALLGPKYSFAKHGQSGAELSELLPGLAQVADDITIVKSMHTDAVNHAPGQILMNTGSQQFGRPSLGAWTVYGLGSESESLPGY